MAGPVLHDTNVRFVLLYAVRTKNMFLFDEQQAVKQFHYRTVMINWLFTPNMTYRDLAVASMGVWNQYLEYESAPGFGSKDPSESWEIWCVMRQRDTPLHLLRPYTLHIYPAPYTLHPTPCTLHPTPYTLLHPTTLHHTP
jgi:hypothetical protein